MVGLVRVAVSSGEIGMLKRGCFLYREALE